MTATFDVYRWKGFRSSTGRVVGRVKCDPSKWPFRKFSQVRAFLSN